METGDRLLEEMRKDKSEKIFWNAMKGGKRSEKIDKGMENEEWLEHLSNQLEGSEEFEETCSKPGKEFQ